MHDQIHNMDEIHKYQKDAKMKTEFERVELSKDKTGVKLDGVNAINPLNNKEIPIFVADYVMMGYGTGAIMAVPAHDTRDYEFATKFGLDIVEVIKGGDITKEAYTDTSSGELINSDFLNGLEVNDAIDQMIGYLEDHKLGEKAINYKMKDWAFNRQRYWGEPIPIVHCEKCGMVAVPEEDLPVTLPKIENFAPSTEGESPLSTVEEFVHTTCPSCGGKATRETDTMPQWAGSSWYFLRYTDPENDQEFAAFDKLQYWMNVDWYNGGMEHVTRHVIYSRFWHLFLHDLGKVPTKEPYKKRTAQGMVLGTDGDKMSKSKGNVVDPLEIIEEFGADTLRLYTLFIGDYEQSTPWNENGVKGARRFLEKVVRLFDKISNQTNDTYQTLLHQTIQAVSEDIEHVKFNTAIAKLMTLVNEFTKAEYVNQEDFELFLKLMNPFAPHLAEELWSKLGHQEDLVEESWPEYDETKLVEDKVEMVISINGKMRDKIEIKRDMSKEDVLAIALKRERIVELLNNQEPKRTIVVPNKIVNIVV
jgi:leucyl-tRNA synthetase